jgi:toxin CptA
MEGEIEPVLVDLQYSGAITALLLAASLATGVIVAFLPWSAPLRLSMLLGVAGLCLRAHRTLFEARAFVVRGGGTVRVLFHDGRSAEGSLQEGSFVAPWLTIVRWRPARARFDRTLVVTGARAHPEAFRRLRVRLRHG